MKFDPVLCLICGKLAKGTLETVPGVALLDIDPDTGESQYGGETAIWWDDQKSNLDSEGRYLLTCHDGHLWPAKMDE
jgi:hypothetical protein